MEKMIDNQYLEAFKHENLAVVKFRSEVFELMTSLAESQVMMDFLKEAEHDRKIKALLLLNEPDCMGDAAYEKFIRSIMKKEDQPENQDVPSFFQKNIRFLQINILNKFIHFLSGYHKIVVVGMSGTIVTPFVGAALVADIRVARPDAKFSMAHRKYGLHPSGAIPFFLTHYLGHSKAMEIQLSEQVTADEAFRLGLITQILPADGFSENAMRYTQSYLNHCRSTLAMTKRLNNFKHRWLDEYFSQEISLMNL